MPTQIIPTSTNVANRNSAQNKSVNCGAVEGCGVACARAQPGTRNIGGVARARNHPFARRRKYLFSVAQIANLLYRRL